MTDQYASLFYGVNETVSVGCDNCTFRPVRLSAATFTTAYVIWYGCLSIGVPGNILSIIIWLRRHAISKNSSAIYLAALAINDIVYQLTDFLLYVLHRASNYSTGSFWTRRVLDGIAWTAFMLETLLVLSFSVERLIAILRPLQVCYILLSVLPVFIPFQ